MADISNGSLNFTSTMNNDQMNAAIEETLRRIQGLSDGTLEGTLKMSDAFDTTAEGIQAAMDTIADAMDMHKSAIADLKNQYDALGVELQRALDEGRNDDANAIQKRMEAINGEVVMRKKLMAEMRNVNAELNVEANTLKYDTAEVQANENAHVSLRSRIRELKEQMADLVMNGISEQSDAYMKLRDELGRLMDLQGDIQAQGSKLANDEAMFQGIIVGAQGATGAMSALAGATALFGDENKSIQEIMLKVQSLMAITMGMQQVAQTLNKDSAFMLTTIGGLKQWWAGVVAQATAAETAEATALTADTAAGTANAAATTASTAATTANTAARGANATATTAQTAATGANTAATGAQTTAAVAGTAANIGLAGAFRLVGAAIKSIPVFGWIIAGISALIGVVSYFSNKAKEAEKASKEWAKSLAEACYEPIGKVEELSVKWAALGNDMNAKTQFIKDNAKAFDDLGVSINGVVDAENLLVEHKQEFIAAQIEKAKASIYLKETNDKIKELIAVEQEYKKNLADEIAIAAGNPGTKLAENFHTQFVAPIKDKLDELNQEITAGFTNAANAEAAGAEQLTKAGIKGTQVYAEGSLGAIQQIIQERQKLLLEATSNEQYAKALNEIAALQAQADAITGKKTKISVPKISTPKAAKVNTTKKTPEEERQEKFQKALDEMRKQYEQFNKYMASGDDTLVATAQKQYAELLKGGETYIEYLKKQRANILAIADGDRTKEQLEQLKALNDAIANETKSSVVDTFKSTLDAQLAAAKTITDQLAVIDKLRQGLPKDKTELTMAKSTALDDAQKSIVNSAKTEYQSMLQEYGTFEQKKAAMAMEFAQKRAIAEANGNTEMLAQLEKAEKEALSKFALDAMMASPDWELMFGDLDELSTRKLEDLLKKINGMTAYLGVEFAPEDLAKIKEAIGKMRDEIQERNPFKALKAALKDYANAADAEAKKKALTNVFKSAAAATEICTAGINGIVDAMTAMGVEADNEAAVILGDLAKIGEAAGNIAQGIATGNPISIIQGAVGLLTAAFDLFNFKDRAAERQIKKHQKALEELQSTYNELQWAIEKALGGDVYKGQMDAIRNMEAQIAELEASIALEDSKKKTDKEKIKEWNEQIAELKRNIADMYDEIANDIVQTDAKSFANELGDALAEAFATGESAAKAFEQTVNNVLKNAILNQLKKNFLEKQLQGVLDELENAMGYWDADEFHFNGLTDQEMEDFKRRVQAIADTYNNALQQYSDIFKSLSDETNAEDSSLVGAVKGVTEDTAEIISGQMQAIRINQAEAVALMRDSMEYMARIANNTSYNYHLAKIERIVSLLEGKSTDAVLRSAGIQA